jgi:RND family efflux transporter MFP subunit
MKKRIAIIVTVLVLFGSIGFVLARNKSKIDAQKVVTDRSQIPVSVAVAKAALGTLSGDLQLPATLEAARTAEISSTTGGKLTSLNLSLGSRVAQGQTVGSVDTRTQALSLADAREALQKAQADLARNRDLFEHNAGTAQSVRDAEYAVEQARIRVQQSGRTISEGAVRAPISGIVTQKQAEVGEYVNTGTPIATVVDVYKLKAVVFVGEKDAYALKLKQPATITAEVLPGKTFTGSVSFISPVGDENHNYRVELNVNNAGGALKAGTYIKVVFNGNTATEALLIPKIALVEGTKNPFVYVVNGDKAILRKLTLGRESGEQIEVLSGLNPGDAVVTSGQINLRDGARVSVLR